MAVKDLGTFIEYRDLPLVRSKFRGQVIVFVSGAFDLLHAAHVAFFEKCKKLGDILVVEVAHDALIRKNKGEGRPILNEQARLKMVGSLRVVDFCFLDVPVEGYPLAFLGTVMELLKPDKYVINTDAWDIPYRRELAQKHGVELVISERSLIPGHGDLSTSDIIEKIRSLPHG
ncbi:MAG: adenylyltransferase/cytidyltransferase family protein [Candidatus Sungiibacteriota bacterium]|uniref:Adenylyltransferase/cytidyltransferase family protein n=1 Tax=Candidatus Sungiibacteriota bacterium TaxID=2750080 RepID=A0A7T5RJW8_9BACT|nr:MAG: adenylyltransferase/cytidyltransferase family protein [Candidatus Sungbacteria bacterium]